MQSELLPLTIVFANVGIDKWPMGVGLTHMKAVDPTSMRRVSITRMKECPVLDYEDIIYENKEEKKHRSVTNFFPYVASTNNGIKFEIYDKQCITKGLYNPCSNGCITLFKEPNTVILHHIANMSSSLRDPAGTDTQLQIPHTADIYIASEMCPNMLNIKPFNRDFSKNILDSYYYNNYKCKKPKWWRNKCIVINTSNSLISSIPYDFYSDMASIEPLERSCNISKYSSNTYTIDNKKLHSVYAQYTNITLVNHSNKSKSRQDAMLIWTLRWNADIEDRIQSICGSNIYIGKIVEKVFNNILVYLKKYPLTSFFAVGDINAVTGVPKNGFFFNKLYEMMKIYKFDGTNPDTYINGIYNGDAANPQIRSMWHLNRNYYEAATYVDGQQLPTSSHKPVLFTFKRTPYKHLVATIGRFVPTEEREAAEIEAAKIEVAKTIIVGGRSNTKITYIRNKTDYLLLKIRKS